MQAELRQPLLAMSAQDTSRIRSPDITPLPKQQLAVLALIQFNEGFQQAVIWPMLPYMVSDFLNDSAQDEDKLGMLVGLLASAFFLSQFISSFIWGWLSDRLGRRPVLLIGILGSSVAIAVLGIAPNYTIAMISRLASGLLNGNAGVVKSYLAEITDASNQVKGFALIAFSYGTSVIIAPMIGGFMTGLWDKYPYLIPCLICAITALMSSVVGFFFLPETQEFIQRGLRDYMEVENVKQLTWYQVFSQREVIVTTSMYGLIAMIIVAFDEMLPLICQASTNVGGFDFSMTQIGALLTTQGISLVIFQLLIYPCLTAKFGFIGKLRYALTVIMIITISFPFLTKISNEDMMWAILFAFMVFKQCHSAIAFTDIIVLINNSCKTENLGTVNGLGQSLASLARTVGPLVVGSLWSLAQSIGAPVIPYVFIVILAALTLLVSIALTNDPVSEVEEVC